MRIEMDKRDYKKQLIKIALPIMLSNLISQVQMLIDKIFLGRLDITCMSAVGNASSPMWTTMNIVFSLSVGGTILMSQAKGAGESEKAQKIMDSLFLYNNVFSVLFFAVWMILPKLIFTIMGVGDNVIGMSVEYARYYSPVFLLLGLGVSVSVMLQVSEKTGILVVYGLVRSLVNIFLDWVLIFGNLGMPRMEVAGAALATTIAEYIGDIVILVYVIVSKDILLKPRFANVLKAKWTNFYDSLKLGLPSALEDFTWNFGSLYLIVMLNRISETAAGIYSIVFSIELLPIVIMDSLGRATLTVSGIETGKVNYKGIKDVVLICIKWSACLGAFILLMCILFPETILSWFTTDRTVIASAAIYLLIIGIDLFPKSGNIIVGSGIKGFGNTKWMFGTQIFGTIFIITMSSILVMGFNCGIAEIFCVVVADETIRVIMNSLKLRSIVNEGKIKQAESTLV